MYEMRGNSRAKQGNFEEAIADFTSVITYSPNDPSPYYERGKALLELNRDQEAKNSLQKAEQLGSQQAASLLRTVIK